VGVQQRNLFNHLEASMFLSAVIAGVRRVVSAVSSSAGSADAGKVPLLGSAGYLHGSVSMLFVTAGVPVDYTDGTPPATGEGVAIPGALCIDTTNKNLYFNNGTKAQPVWAKMAKFSDIT
jgi:hypothetical protein